MTGFKLRCAVSRFADRINQQIKDIPDAGWHAVSSDTLVDGLDEQLTALKCAHRGLRQTDEPAQYEQIARKAADLAASLMMIADNAEVRNT